MKTNKLQASNFRLPAKLGMVLILILSQLQNLYAQSEIERLIEERIESIIESTEEDIDETDLYDRLIELSQNPVNLNCKNFKILVELHLINEYQYFKLLDYANQLQIQSIREITFLDGFSESDFEQLKIFITVAECKQEKFKLYRPKHEISSGFEMSFPKKAGYDEVEDETLADSPNKAYLGSPEKIYTRYKITSGKHLQAGFIAEKDPGEVLFKNNYSDLSNELLDKNPKVPDYLSGFASLDDLWFINKLIVGDYQLQFGQGLSLWSSLGFGKSSASTAIKKYARGVIPNTSANENQFFRGIASSVSYKKLEMNLFYSNKKRDANIVSEDEFSSLQNTGYHRTIGELSDKNSVSEKVYGANLNYTIKRIKIGITAYHQSFDKTYITDDQPYKKYYFSGKENYCFGSDFQAIFKNIDLFGEIAFSKNNAKAVLAGMTVYLNSLATFHFHYRNYSKAFQNFYTAAISENTNPRNEKGFYAGTEIELHAKWKLSAYTDFFRFPWLKMGVDAPSKGNEQLLQLEYKHSRSLLIYGRYKRQRKEQNQDEDNIWFNYLIPKTDENIRLHFSLQLSPKFEWQGRGEWHHYELNKSKSRGFLIFQEINFTTLNNKLKCSFRYTNFNTNDYDSRIYTYEKDVRYTFSVPSFYGQGNRCYFMITYQLKDGLTTCLKFAQTTYYDRDQISSGLELIDGNHKTEVKFQLQIKL